MKKLLPQQREIAHPILSQSTDPVLLRRAQPHRPSIMGCGQMFCLSGFVRNSWLQSRPHTWSRSRFELRERPRCTYSPTAFAPQVYGLKFHREPNKLCFSAVALKSTCVDRKISGSRFYTSCDSEASSDTPQSCDLAVLSHFHTFKL